MVAVNWQTAILGNFVTYQKGFAFKSSEYRPYGHPIVRVSNFSDRTIEMTDCNYIDPENVPQYLKFALSTDDVVIATVGSWPSNEASVVGKAIRVPPEAGGALLNQNAVRLRGTCELNQRFLFYLLKNKYFQTYIVGTAQGSANQASITLRDIFAYEFLLPPLPEQHAIAHILGTLDDKIELNRQINHTLEAIARAIFKSWFVDFDPVWAKLDGEQPYGMDAETAALFPDTFTDSPIGPIPEGWMVKRLSDICESVRYGYTASAKSEKVGPKFLRITDIVPYSINWDTVPYCEIENKDLDKYLLKEGDIVVARTGATVGYAKRIGKRRPKAVFASYLVRMRIRSNYSNYLIGLIVESDEYKEFIWTNRGGSAQPQANAKVMTSYSIILPPNKLQQRFDDAVKTLLDYRELLQQKSRTLAELRDTLLPKLISGQLCVPDAEKLVGEIQ